MKFFKKMGLFAPILSFLFAISLNAAYILKNEDLLPEKTVRKIEQMGEELYKKSGVSVYIAAVQKMEDKNFIEYEKKLSKNLKKPFILLTISLNDKKIDIINSKELEKRFNKEQILSPWPWRGTILPLLTAKTKNPKANIEAALLNGYADIVEQVASSYGIKLESAIGNQNKITFNIVKLFFYGIILFILIKIIYRRVIKNEKR